VIESLLSHSLLFFDSLLTRVVSTLHFQFPAIFFSFTILVQKDFEKETTRDEVKKKEEKKRKKERKKEREESKRIEETRTDRAKNEVNHVFSYDLSII